MSGGQRIGLMGGSFDPPHLAHLALAEAARRQLQLTELRWLPAGQPWQKAARVLAPAPMRLEMLRLLLDDGPAPGSHLIDTRELQRNGPTYTIDSVREMQAERPEIPPEHWFLILGQDQYAHFHTWREWRQLLDRVTLAVAAREGHAVVTPPELAAYPHRLQRIELPPMPISASDVRRRAAAAPGDAHATSPLVGEAVAGYIARHRLYANPPAARPSL